MQGTRGSVHVLLARELLPQLERCAAERDALEVLLPLEQADAVTTVSPAWDALPAALHPQHSPPRTYECWASLLVRSGPTLEGLRRRRSEERRAGEEQARQALSAVSRRLLERDPAATMHVDEGEGPGEYVVEIRGCFDEHPVSWTGVVDRFSSADELVRAVLASCQCC